MKIEKISLNSNKSLDASWSKFEPNMIRPNPHKTQTCSNTEQLEFHWPNPITGLTYIIRLEVKLPRYDHCCKKQSLSLINWLISKWWWPNYITNLSKGYLRIRLINRLFSPINYYFSFKWTLIESCTQGSQNIKLGLRIIYSRTTIKGPDRN